MRVFVYGSLMRGLHNHHVLGDSRFLYTARIEAGRFRMISLGGFPGLIPDESGPEIKGELYQVDDATAKRLDALEGHPRFYHREWVMIQGETTKGPVAYILTDPEKYQRYERVESGDWRAFLRERSLATQGVW